MRTTGDAEGASPSVVNDHDFVPESDRLGMSSPPWGLCGICGLAAAAHASGAIYTPEAAMPGVIHE